MDRWIATLAALALLVAAAHADAQPASPEHEAAASAFEEGRRLVREGRCPDAIEKFRTSIAHEPSVGARLSLAQCFEASDPLQAWRELKEAELLAGALKDDRVAVARERAAALEPRLAMLRIVVPAAISGLEVQLDGAHFDRLYYASGAVAVTPGPHVVSATAPGKATWSKTLDAAPGKQVVASVVLEDQPPAPAPKTEPLPAQQAEAEATPTRPAVMPNRTLSFVVGGIGVAGLAAGGVLGLIAIGEKKTVQNDCGAGAGYPACVNLTASARDDNRKLQTFATASTVAFAVGAAGVVAGTVLFLTARSTTSSVAVRVAPVVGEHGGGAGAFGAF